MAKKTLTSLECRHGEVPARCAVCTAPTMLRCHCGQHSWPRGATRSSGGIPDRHSLTSCRPEWGDTRVDSVKPYDPPPTHYATDKGIDPWAVWDAFDLDRYTANAVKYLLRAGKKDIAPRLDDLRKARNYINKAIEMEEGK